MIAGVLTMKLRPIRRGLADLARAFGRELHVYRLVLKDPRTPWAAKALLAAAVAYFVSPIDLIPDFIPFFGQLDDLLIVPALVFLAIRLIPAEVIADCRRAAIPPTDDSRQRAAPADSEPS